LEVQLSAETYQRPVTQLLAQVSVYGPRERLRRALTGALPFLGGALVTLPIPPLHFFSVPACLTLMVVVFRRRLREERVFELLRGPCPGCDKLLDLRAPSGKLPPYLLPCPGCGEFLKLSELR
jgi:hypothetical protein